MNFTDRLFALVKRPPSELSDVELRLLRIIGVLLPQLVILTRCQSVSEDHPEPLPLSPGVVKSAARMAFAAAIEIEKPLRDLRDRLEQRG